MTGERSASEGPEVILMICYARSGGTLLNRCLSALPNTLVLSEVHPMIAADPPTRPQTVRSQAKQWYNTDLQSHGFLDGLVELAGICDQAGRKLVAREWTFGNFDVAVAGSGWRPPGRLLTLETLKGRLAVTPFAFVRDGIDVWISRGRPPASEFFGKYLTYVKALRASGVRVFKYEDFCSDPAGQMLRLCEHCGLEYAKGFLDEYLQVQSVTGDVGVPGGSRGARQKGIRPLRRKRIRRSKVHEVNGCAEMVEANELLGYPTDYFGVRVQGWSARVLDALSRRMHAVRPGAQKTMQGRRTR